MLTQETMRVLRAHREQILTLLEVFLHDPLYKWSLSPQKMQQLRGEEHRGGDASEQLQAGVDGLGGGAGNTVGNTGATRALFQVRQRLHGEEFGETLSVEGQVRLLIHSAMQPENLCRMYFGWCPWV
jgi:ataxia telangiectasia mutated family protein